LKDGIIVGVCRGGFEWFKTVVGWLRNRVLRERKVADGGKLVYWRGERQGGTFLYAKGDKEN